MLLFCAGSTKGQSAQHLHFIIRSACNLLAPGIATFQQIGYRLDGLVQTCLTESGPKIVRDRSEAEEIVQEVLLAIHQQRERFDPSVSTAPTWILHFGYKQRRNAGAWRVQLRQ
jgi:hypothetical protein